MSKHVGQVEGEEIRRKIGSTWFVSYLYHELLDPTHMNWNKISSDAIQLRISYFNKSKQYHKGWLQSIDAMKDANLKKNTIGLEPQEIKRMANELLEKMS